MNISSTRALAAQTRIAKQTTPQAPAQEQDATPAEPQEKFEAWMPLANAAVVGGAVAVPTALGAIGSTLFPNAGIIGKTAIIGGAAAIAGTGAGMWAVKGGKEEFNGHPILTGLGGALAGGAAFFGTALLSPIGVEAGWAGVGIATAVGAVGGGVISGIGMYMASKGDAQ